MNKIYKLVWSKTRNMYVAVSELAKSHAKSPSGSYMSKTIVAGVLASVISCGAVVPQVYAEVNPQAGANYVLYDGADAAKITLEGGLGIGTVIDNVANGFISAASKEAVNGSQLYALTTRVDNFETSLTTLNTAVAVAQTDINSIKTTNITLRSDVNTLQTEVETGFNVNVNGAKVKSVTPTSNYINFKSGNGIVVSNDNNEAVKIALDTNGAVASGNTLAVTGGTAYTELRPASDGNYVATANTTATNLTALDSQLKTTTDGLATEITDRQTAVTNEATARSDADTALGNRIGSVSVDGNYIKESSTKNIAENLGLLDTAVKANADTIAQEITDRQTADTALGARIDGSINGLTINGQTITYTKGDGTTGTLTTQDTTYTAGDGLTLIGTEFKAKAGTNVTVDTNGINVAGNGTVATGDTGLVSGGTLYTEVRPTADGNYIATTNSTATNLTALDTQLKATTDNLATEVTNRTNADTALSDRIGSIANDGNYIKASADKNVAENLGLLDTAVKANADAIISNKTHYLGVISSAVGSADLNYDGEGATGVDAVALGPSARATAESSMALGDYAKADGLRSIAVGNSAGATNDYGIAIGGLSKAQADGAIALGTSANGSGANSMALGNSSKAEGATSYAIGQGANSKGESSIAFGTSTESATTGVAVGHMAKATGESGVAIGTGTTAGKTAIAVGHGATASTEASTAIGINSSATANHAVALGTGSIASEANTVSVGNTTTKRRIVNVADATGDNDAINLKQLNTTKQALEDSISDLSDGKANISLDNITDAGKTVVRDLAKESVKVVAGNKTTVTEGIDGTYKTYAVNVTTNGVVAENNTDIVTGGAVYDALHNNELAFQDALDLKANKDASNIAANTAQWGTAIGTGSVVQNNGELVTGGTVYSALQAQKSDIQTELVGKANVALDNITTDGHNVIKDDAKSVINVTGDGNASVTKTTSAGVDIYKVTVTANGSVAKNNADIVSGGTMYTELRPTADGNYITTANTTAGNLAALDTQLKTTMDNLATEVTNRTNADTALSDRIGTITTDGNYIKDSDEKNLSENLGLLDTAVKANADAITANKTHFFGVNSTDDTDSNYDGAGAIGADAIAIGISATAKSDGSLAIGPAAYAEDEDSIGIGNSITVTNSGTGLGAYSTISGERAIGVGYATVVEGNSAVAIGDSSAVLGNNSTVIGSNANSSASATNGTALGYNADVSASNAVAIGSDSVANAENVVSFGHRKNDAYTGATTGSTYDADLFRRLTNVADGVDSHDVATVGQVNTSLDGKANADASNIGSNITLPASAYPDGATDEEKATILANAQKANSEAWGTAIGTGTVANNNSELVTGGSMYVELRPTSGNYVSQTNTTAQNLIALDTQVKANANAITANKTHFFGVNSDNEYDMNYNGGGATGTNAVAVGPGAWADSENSIAIGNTSATMFGEKAIAIGYLATSLAENAVAVGSSAQAPNAFATAVGSKAVASGWSSTAIGKNAYASGKNSIAVGSDSTATGEDEFSIGRPAVEANAETGQTAQPEVKRRLTHVDTGTNDTDAVNVKQLTDGLGLKANVDASNIGSNLILPDSAYPNGATDEEKAEILANAQKTNSEAWGSAIGTGTVTTNNNELVTGGTLYTEVRPATDGNYITTANSTAMNLGVLDTQLKTTTDSLSTETTNRENADTELSHRIGELGTNGAYIRTSNDVSENLTVLDSAVTSKANNDASNIGRNADGQNNASAWGAALGTDILQSGSNILLTSGGVYSELHLSESGNYVDNTKTTAQNIALLDEQLKDTTDLIDALNESAVQYDDATKKKVTLQGGTDGTIIDKVEAGALTASSMEAVNGSQLYAEQQARIEAIGSISADGNYIKKDKNVYENLSLLDTNIRNINATVTDAVIYDSENHNLVTLTGANGTKLTNLKAATLSASSTDAVIGAQLYATNQNIAGFATDINRNKENIRNLNTSVSSALSSVSSTSSLVSTLDNLKADTSLTNLSATGRQVITTAAINAVQEYMAAQQGNNNPATPSAPMMYGSNPNTLNVTNAGNGSLYVGEGSNVNGSQSIAIGVGNQVNANNSGAFGDPSIIDADNSYVLGNDDRITSVAKGSFVVGNDSKADAESSLIFGSNSVSNGKNGVALGNNTVVGGENSVAIGNGSDAMDDNVVSVGNATIQRKIINVANGTIAEDSTDAVTGGQLFETNERVTANENAIATKAEADASNINVSDWTTKLGVGKVEEGNTDLVNGGTVFDALKEVKQDSFIQTDGEIMTIGANQGGSTINVANNAGEARVITGVATNPNDPTSVANVGYVDAVGTNIMNSVNAGFDKIDTKVNKVGANAAAMASLTPASFEGDEKWSLSAGVGNYRGETAGAIGAFYKPTENVMMNVRGSFGNNENMIGAAVSVSLSKGDVPGLTKRQLARAVNAQAFEIQTLKTERANERQVMEAMRYEREQDRQKIAQLEKMVQELAQKVK